MGAEKETGWKPVPLCWQTEQSPHEAFHPWWRMQVRILQADLKMGERSEKPAYAQITDVFIHALVWALNARV
jgi:hypothetical protein